MHIQYLLAKIVSIVAVLLSVNVANIDAIHRYYNFIAAYVPGSPDGVPVDILAANGKFPGPEIRCTLGDTVHVTVTNNVRDRQLRTYPLSVHWHGLLMDGTPFADGPDYITQCPIPYGKSYEYVFTPNQTGTYWWHSHATWQYSEGFWGVLIVDNPSEHYKDYYNKELTFALSDWYHRSGRINTDWYISPASGARSPIPDSAMINGRGFYPCHIAALKGVACHPQQLMTFEVRRNDRVRIRIINTSAVLSFQFSIEDHSRFYVIEVDGVDTVPVPCDTLIISPAQRYSIIVTMNARPGAYTEQQFLIHANMVNVFGTANVNINTHPEALAEYSGQPAAILKYKSVTNNFVRPLDEPDSDVMPAVVDSVAAVEPSQLSKSASIGKSDQSEAKTAPWPVGASGQEQLDYLIKNPGVLRPGQQPAGASGGFLEKPGPGSKFNASANTDFIIQIATSPPQKFGRDIGAKKVPLGFNNFFQPWVILNEKDLKPYDQIPAPNYNDQEITLSVDYVTDPATDIVHITFNGTAFHPTGTPYLFRMLRSEPIPNEAHVLRIKNQNVIQVVIRNPSAIPHPFHLHGHTFWVVGSGKIGQSVDWTPMGARRDTAVVDSESVLYIKFIADNPGAWLFHCHINWHHQAGLSAVFIESPKEAIAKYGAVPASAEALCGQSALVACEGSNLQLVCPVGKKIMIFSANFGRTEGASVCPHPSILTTDCKAGNSLAVVSASCNNLNQCSVPATNAVFGDPCAGTFKYLKVTFNCI